MIATRTPPLRAGKTCVFTEPDFDRLSRLVDSPKYRMTHAAQLDRLRAELDQSEIVPVMEVPRGVVTMHSRVRVRDLRTGESESYALVYPHEADIEQSRLSILAPLGIALIGMHTGQIVSVKVPAGIRRLKVERIVYQPEAAGDLHL